MATKRTNWVQSPLLATKRCRRRTSTVMNVQNLQLLDIVRSNHTREEPVMKTHILRRIKVWPSTSMEVKPWREQIDGWVFSRVQNMIRQNLEVAMFYHKITGRHLHRINIIVQYWGRGLLEEQMMYWNGKLEKRRQQELLRGFIIENRFRK